MGFFKYPSIENHYRNESIKKWVEAYPELVDETFVIEEKIHGANIQFIFEPGKEMEIASRNRILAPDEDFYGVRGIIKQDEYKRIFHHVKEYSDSKKVVVNLYGEICGPGVQKGINYGDKRRVLFFDLMEEGKIIPPRDKERLLIPMLDKELVLVLVPLLVVGLKNALDFNCKINSEVGKHFGVDGENIMEGVVIKPYYKTYTSPTGDIFYIKKVNEGFREIQKSIKEPYSTNPGISEHNKKFCGYINTNRLDHIISHEGPIGGEKEQIQKYIMLLLADAKKDFLKDCPEVRDMDKRDQKAVFNVGNLAYRTVLGCGSE